MVIPRRRSRKPEIAFSLQFAVRLRYGTALYPELSGQLPYWGDSPSGNQHTGQNQKPHLGGNLGVQGPGVRAVYLQKDAQGLHPEMVLDVLERAPQFNYIHLHRLG